MKLWLVHDKFLKIMVISCGCFQKYGWAPKMDGENNGKNPIKMDDLGGKPTILGNPHSVSYSRPKKNPGIRSSTLTV